MQITSLSNVNTLNVWKQSESVKAGKTGDFANLLSGRMQREQSASKQQVKKDDSLSNKELEALTQFLQLGDITEIENSTGKFRQMLLNDEMDKTDFTDFIKSLLQLSDQEWLSSLFSFLEGINFEGTEEENTESSLAELMYGLPLLGQQPLSVIEVDKTNFNQSQQKGIEQELTSLYSFLRSNNLEETEEGRMLQNLAGLREAVAKGNTQGAIETLIELLPKIDMDQVSFSLNHNAVDAIKSLKLFQLLSKYGSPESEQKVLSTLLQKVEGTLNGIVREDKTANRKEFLHQIFTPVVKEAKQDTLLFKQTYSPILSQVLTGEEQISENHLVKTGTSIDSNSSLSLQFQHIAKSEQLVLMMEKSGQPVSSDQLIAQFERILAASHMMKSGNTQRMFIKLNPDHLGMLKVELIQNDNGMIAKITAATGAAKEILESQLQSLKNAFSSQNIQLDKIEITLQTNEQERFLSKDSQQENKEQEQRKNDDQKQQQSEEFSAAFAEALISTEA